MITITESAAEHVKTYIAKRGKGEGIRFGVKSSGCSGFSYTLEFVDKPTQTDQVFENFGVKVFVDPMSLPYVTGTELDYVREGLQEGFKYNNPQQANTCGCGESFTV